jgi:hypothetical protein
MGVGVVITACSGDSSGGGNGGSTGTGTTGAGGGAPRNACTSTNCPVDQTAIPDSVCNLILGSHCRGVAMAYYACSLAHDSCQADGTQDGSKVTTSCASETDAFTTCDPNGDGGIY